jgi:cold-inducible RNA-binding protein
MPCEDRGFSGFAGANFVRERNPADLPKGRLPLEDRMASKLFVGNLPHSVSDAQLNEFVINAGYQVASAVVIRDKLTGTPRGFGFVELAEGEDIQRAISGLNGQTLEGRPLTVNEAQPQRTGFGRGPGGGGGRGGYRGRSDRGGGGRRY